LFCAFAGDVCLICPVPAVRRVRPSRTPTRACRACGAQLRPGRGPRQTLRRGRRERRRAAAQPTARKARTQAWPRKTAATLAVGPTLPRAPCPACGAGGRSEAIAPMAHLARDGSRGVTPSVLLCDCSQVRVDLLLGQAREPFPALAHDADLDVPGLEIHAQHSLEATNCLLDRLGLRHV